MNRCNASIRARLCLIGDAGVFRAWHYSESRPPYPKMIDLSTPGLAYLTLLSPAMRRSGTRTEVCYRAYLPSSIWAASVNVLGSYRCAGHFSSIARSGDERVPQVQSCIDADLVTHSGRPVTGFRRRVQRSVMLIAYFIIRPRLRGGSR